ncbi:MAG: SRPBCC family protein [Saprospiraceae bacterium]|nr:SRPBCC family protein [Saprospiraceae bacterium]MDW8483085.1 SRPBCC family protein [Saprospiraceae bacterium]
MGVYVLKRTQRLPISIQEAWAFFSSPLNLPEITPPYLGFEILSERSWLGRMYAGQIVTYKVRPLLGIPMFWMTEITHVREGEFFVDEQRIGPYAFWHHQHHFKPIAGGVEMTDIVHYRLPLGIIGKLAHVLFVRRQLEEIFNYRYRVLEKRFGRIEAEAPVVEKTVA